MVFLNYSAKEMVAKIVYYGPGLGGKTTNLKTIYQKTSKESRGEMVSLATETDRTLFFDLLPMEVGVIGGFKTKFQLYTVPGQVFYNTTRKLVLRGVDGIVFVADSQIPMREANIESFQNLKDNLAELNLHVEDIPLVLQFNKRDLPNIQDVAGMNKTLNEGDWPWLEASAINGIGVFETLREISKQTLLILNERNLQEVRPTSKKSGSDTNPMIQRPDNLDALDDMPEDVSFEDLEEDLDASLEFSESNAEPPVAKEEIGRDSFEQTLGSMELDFSDEERSDHEGASRPPSMKAFEEMDEELDLDEENLPDFDLEIDDDSLDDALADPESVEEKPGPEADGDHTPVMTVRQPKSQHDGEANPLVGLEENEAEGEVASEPEATSAEQPEPEPETAQAHASAAEATATSDPVESLAELERFTTRLHAPKTAKKRRRKSSVDDLLTDLVDKPAKPKTHRAKVTVPEAIADAQLNCVFLDESGNVVHTHLLKVTPTAKGPGSYRVKLDLEIDVE